MATKRQRRRKSANGSGSTTFHAASGKWMARAYVPDPETGVLKRRTWYADTEREARERMQAALADYRSGAAVVRDGRELTLRQWYETWLAGLQVRPRTKIRYVGLMAHVLAQLGDRPLSRITPTAVSGLIRQLHRDGAPTTRGERPLKSRGANRVRDVLRNCLAEAVRQGKIARNAAELAKPVREDDVEETAILPPDKVATFLDMAEDAPDGNLWVFSLATGCRLAEAQGLRWSDVEGDVAHIRQTVARVERQWAIDAPKTKRSRRDIRLPVAAQAALQREKSRQAALRLAAENWPDTFDGYVFLTEKGEPRIPTTVTDRMKAAMTDAGLEPIRFHDLRHSAASWMVALGVPVTEVSRTLGHSRSSTTTDFYVKAGDGTLTAAAMDRALAR